MSTESAVGAVVGGAIGFVVSGFNPAGALYGAALGAGVGAVLGGGPKIEGPRLSDLSIQTSTYGADIPRVYGTIVVSGNVLWLENNKLRERKSDGGGKGGGASAADEYTYYATFHLGLADCPDIPIQGIRRIWCSDKLLYDGSASDTSTIIASDVFRTKKFTFYKGTDDQQPSARYQADVGVDNATAHRGMSYIEYRNLELTDFGNTLEGAQFRVELVVPEVKEAPVYMHDRPFVGIPVYSDEATLQTAEYYTKFFEDDGETEWFVGTVTFRTYAHSGALIREERRSARVERAGLNTLSSHEVLFLRGVKYGVFVVNPFKKAGGALDAQLPTSFTMSAVNTGAWVLRLSDGYTMFPNLNGDFAVISPTGVVTYSSLAYQTDGMYLAESDDGRVFWANNFIGFNNIYFGEIDRDGTVLWAQYMGTMPAGWGRRSFAISEGRVLMHQIDTLRLYDIGDASITLNASISLTGGSSVYDYAPGFGVTASGRVYQMTDRGGAGYEDLDEVVVREVERSALLTADDVDVSLLTGQTRGYRISGGSIRSALEPLATAHQFAIVQDGYKLKVVPRGQGSVLTIPYEDMGATNGDQPKDVFKRSREMDSQLPAKITVKYLDAAREYDIGEQSSTRINTEAVNEEEVELAMVLTADEGAGIAEVLRGRAWLDRDSYEESLPPTYLALQPGDVFTQQTPDADYEIYINEIEYTQDGRVEIKGTPNAASVFTPNASGGEGTLPDGTIGVAGPTVFVPLDIPVVDETYQNQLGFVGVMTGYTDGWPGGVLYRSGDNGQTWLDIEAWNTKCTIGSAPDVLGAHDGYLIDQSELPVLVISGELESITRDQMLTGANFAAYGKDGRWEILRFQKAVLQADGSYTLSHFVRGDRGTEWATGLHEVGDYFILLTDPDNVFISMASESLTLERIYRGITNRAALDTGDNVSFAYQGVNLEPLSPVHARATRDGSGDLTATFVRRSRLSSSWWSTGVVAPVGENAESYSIDVMNGSTVVNTLSSSAAGFSYSAADQTTDFGSPQSSITFRIYQLSEVVGRGYVREVTL
ncbi:phage tail protein [Halopseudomonas sp.]|uniref:phage tail protein n=1 Tax=Halopseudomonas sp. TaxID=2901191 RepID=UPI00311FB5F2